MTCEKYADVCTSCPEGNISASLDKFASDYNIINIWIQATGHALGNMG